MTIKISGIDDLMKAKEEIWKGDFFEMDDGSSACVPCATEFHHDDEGRFLVTALRVNRKKDRKCDICAAFIDSV